MSYLFGDISMVSKNDLWLVAGMDVLVAAVGLGFYNKFLALCFDEEFAELRGVQAKLLYLILLCLTALTVVLLMRVVGIVLVIALLTLPPAVAGYFSRQLWQMMLLAMLFCAVVVGAGIAVSYPVNLPSGPVIILLAGSAYLLVTIASLVWKKLRSYPIIENINDRLTDTFPDVEGCPIQDRHPNQANANGIHGIF